MDLFSPLHWLLVIAIVLLLFGGRGKISGIMGDFAKGIKAFKSGIKEPEEKDAAPAGQMPPPAAAPDASKDSMPPA